MKTMLVRSLALGLLALPMSVPAAQVTFNYTTDNVLSIWGQCAVSSCQSPEAAYAPGPNGGNWLVADSATLNLSPGVYTFAFFAQNFGTGSSTNPGGFLAEILLGSQTVVSSSSWDVTVCPNADPNSCAFGGWVPATQWGTNGAANIWTSVKGGAVAGISSAANWIWTANNFTSSTDQFVAFRTTFRVVPEPGTLALLGLGLLGLGAARRRR